MPSNQMIPLLCILKKETLLKSCVNYLRVGGMDGKNNFLFIVLIFFKGVVVDEAGFQAIMFKYFKNIL